MLGIALVLAALTVAHSTLLGIYGTLLLVMGISLLYTRAYQRLFRTLLGGEGYVRKRA